MGVRVRPLTEIKSFNKVSQISLPIPSKHQIVMCMASKGFKLWMMRASIMSLGATLCCIVLNCCYSAAFTNLPIIRPTIIQQQRWTQEKISSPLHKSRRSGNHDRVITTSSSGDHPHYHSFDEMKSMESRLDHLQRKAPELLCGFYEKHLKSFSVTPGSATVSLLYISYYVIDFNHDCECPWYSNLFGLLYNVCRAYP